MGDTWHLDELFVAIQGRQQYLWRAVDEDGDVIDILVQSRRNRRAAVRFFRILLKNQGCVPRRLITDKLRSYPAARRAVMPSVVHCTDRYANNRAEVSHQPTRQRERQMRGFKSAAQLQRFASVHGVVQNLFRVGRHLLAVDARTGGRVVPLERSSGPRLALTTPTTHNARHQHIRELSMSLSECTQRSSVCSPKRGGFPDEFDEGGGLKNRCRFEGKK